MTERLFEVVADLGKRRVPHTVAADRVGYRVALAALNEVERINRELDVIRAGDSIRTLVDVERAEIERAIRVSCNVKEAARRLGVGTATVYRKLKEYRVSDAMKERSV